MELRLVTDILMSPFHLLISVIRELEISRDELEISKFYLQISLNELQISKLELELSKHELEWYITNRNVC